MGAADRPIRNVCAAGIRMGLSGRIGSIVPSPLGRALARLLAQLETPRLFALAVALFLLDLVLPDPVPLVDEILLAIAVLLLARRKRPRRAGGAYPLQRRG